MANSNLKLLAQRAKNRLKSVGATIEEAKSNGGVKSMALSNHEYAIIATRVKIEDDPLFAKANRLITKNPDAFNILGELIERNEYNALTPIGKQKYILNLASRFNKIRAKLAI